MVKKGGEKRKFIVQTGKLNRKPGKNDELLAIIPVGKARDGPWQGANVALFSLGVFEAEGERGPESELWGTNSQYGEALAALAGE
ncbi:MAG TPA: hypothetical protein VHP83_17590 [Aggregatilineaceae bacterium]|nr:hypothetical protein [Aggregatilineaceae bacterium]